MAARCCLTEGVACLPMMVSVMIVAMRGNVIKLLLTDVQVNVKMWPVITRGGGGRPRLVRLICGRRPPGARQFSRSEKLRASA